MKTVAYFATYFTNNVSTTGIALRDASGQVFFRTEATGQWRALTDADAPNLHLHGRCDLVQMQAALDGNLVITTSRTVSPAA